jgi:hypothetical protein
MSRMNILSRPTFIMKSSNSAASLVCHDCRRKFSRRCANPRHQCCNHVVLPAPSLNQPPAPLQEARSERRLPPV